MSPTTRRSALALGWALLSASLLHAQGVTGLTADHRHGQTFLTWNEVPDSTVTYRVYRSNRPIVRPEQLDVVQPVLGTADFLGGLDSQSTWNRGRSFASGGMHNFIVAPGASPLSDDVGLFVHTVAEPPPIATPGDPYPAVRGFYYAVTSVHGGVEDRTLAPGVNTSAARVREWAAPPQAVLQAQDGVGMLFAHWVGNRPTPFQRALSLRASHGFNFRYDPGTAPAPRGLAVKLHAAGQSYAIGWPHRHEVQADVDLLSVSDLYPGPGWTLWLGAHTDYPDPPGPTAEVSLFTLERVRWTIDWVVDQLGDDHDPERLYAVGASMGAMGSMYLSTEFPARFAAILCRNGNYDLAASDVNNPTFIQQLLGPYATNLAVRGGPGSDGLGVYDRTNLGLFAQLAPQANGPVIRTINGRNDTTVGWLSALSLFDGLEAGRRPAIHYFDERMHSPFGFWQALEQELLTRTFATRRDRPSVRFSDLTIDDDPGQGDPDQGDPVGTLNAYVDYDPTTAVATADAVELEVFLRDEGELDDAPRSRASVKLTPRRTAPFTLKAGDEVLFTLREEDGTVVAQHTLVADAYRLVTTPRVEVTTDRRTARFERVLELGVGKTTSAR